jgi:3-isopropylmalate/(R)-2-methylmalate dehydratase small subunit
VRLPTRESLLLTNNLWSKKIKGRAFKFGDNISTDLIIPGRYVKLRSNLQELAKHALEDADPSFTQRVQKGDFVVAGNNFGLGSSREHAPLVIKISGVSAILAKSVARIFFRNAINIGLPVLICDTDNINDGDKLDVDLKTGKIIDLTSGTELHASGLPNIMLNTLNEGGLVPYIKKYGDFIID